MILLHKKLITIFVVIILVIGAVQPLQANVKNIFAQSQSDPLKAFTIVCGIATSFFGMQMMKNWLFYHISLSIADRIDSNDNDDSFISSIKKGIANNSRNQARENIKDMEVAIKRCIGSGMATVVIYLWRERLKKLSNQ